MLQYILKRILTMIPTLIAISVVSFAVITLPPGDYLSARVGQLRSMGADEEYIRTEIENLEARYGLGRPLYVQYWKWVVGIVTRGDFGDSFQSGQPVAELIWARLGFTVLLSLFTTLFIWAIAFPVGIYSAVKKYSLGDYIATLFGFIGRAVPSFLVALILMYIMFKVYNRSVGGLLSPEYVGAPWSLAKVGDLVAHLWIPIVILGLDGTAGLIRTMRANLLDELHKPYVTTARAKGLSEARLLAKYPVRVALNPFISGLSGLLPGLVGGATIISVVLNLPTTGPLLLAALQTQDMYLAGSFILVLSTLAVISTLLSDILLAWVDPRIRRGFA